MAAAVRTWARREGLYLSRQHAWLEDYELERQCTKLYEIAVFIVGTSNSSMRKIIHTYKFTCALEIYISYSTILVHYYVHFHMHVV